MAIKVGGTTVIDDSRVLSNLTFPTLNQNTTGTAAGLSSTLAIASGGTGATTASAALTALGGASTGKAIAMALVFSG